MSISRREFLKSTYAVGAAVSGMASPAEAAVPRVSSEWYGMLTDLSLCVGCRQCEWACNKAHGLPNQPLSAFEDKSVFENLRRTDAEKFTVVNRFRVGDTDQPVYVKKQCMHCLEPACASACPVDAYTKTKEGPVVYNKDVCIGCRYCMVACPFGIPTYEYSNAFTPKIEKCTMCHERFAEEGKKPACADACPEEAITFGKRADLIALAREKIQRHPDRYVDHIYGEHEAGGTCWLYISPVPFEQLGFPTDIGTTPLPELTEGDLTTTVPLVLAAWPMLLMGTYAFNHKRNERDRQLDGKPTWEAVP